MYKCLNVGVRRVDLGLCIMKAFLVHDKSEPSNVDYYECIYSISMVVKPLCPKLPALLTKNMFSLPASIHTFNDKR